MARKMGVFFKLAVCSPLGVASFVPAGHHHATALRRIAAGGPPTRTVSQAATTVVSEAEFSRLVAEAVKTNGALRWHDVRHLVLSRMLVFNPSKRCTMEDALNSEYMAALHQGRELPQMEEHFSFGFERNDITANELRSLIRNEMEFFHKPGAR